MYKFVAMALVGLCMVGSVAAGQAFQDPMRTPSTPSRLAASQPLQVVLKAGARLIAAGERGQVVVSDDGGTSWRQIQMPVSSDLLAGTFVTPRTGWLVGHDGVVLKTTDGGESWALQLDGRQAAEQALTYYQKMAATNPDAQAMLGDMERFVAEGPDKPFLSVWFQDENSGYLVGAFNLIFHTDDGGKSWVPWMDRVDNPEGLHLRAIDGVGDHVYIAGERGLLLKLDPERQRFVEMKSPYAGTFFSLLARNEKLLVGGLRGNLFRSQDAGVTWQKVETGSTASVMWMAELNAGDAVVVNLAGDVWHLHADGNLEPAKVDRAFSFYGATAAGNGHVAFVGSQGVQVQSVR
ncbi:photosystem II stability/assembly factor-like uncharacterized protein [Pseudomonas sp. JAI111]|uniref:YCF48-related protein n=1 Tax=Pseudomonas sp. JAI111 TaxID=2735913 RepID=UPI002167E0AF|nr:YCF48-related protein [Pseudomonas sp. JAI111]MCS3835687.1 photosystem II stability/assembly factor-like uncharacterized protein [Pseudomonas sp. JAI111]